MTSLTRQRDPLCRFYTKPEFGSVLVSALDCGEPASIVDVAAGAGALSAAALRRWAGAESASIDIDPDRTPLADGRPRRHFAVDVLDPDLPAIVLDGGEGFDLTLCNPPFRKVEWAKGHGRILEEAGLGRLISTPRNATSEVLFVAQTLRLAKPGATIGLILPDGLVTGGKSSGFREALLENAVVDTVIQLPGGAFVGTQARAFIVLLRRGKPVSEQVTLKRFDAGRGLSEPILVSRDDAGGRLDFAYHADRPHGSRTQTLADIGASVIRGTLETTDLRRCSQSTFHAGDFPGPGEDRVVRLNDQSMLPEIFRERPSCAEGDILLARVDRNLHRKVCYVEAGTAALSSSVLRLRVPSEWRARIFRFLSSPAGERYLGAIARGVGPRMIAKSELMKMPVSDL